MNTYLAQFNIDHGFSDKKKILFFPYSAGCIWSYANQFTEIRDNFKLKEFFIEKVDPQRVVDSLDNPKIFGFSSYVWNAQYNLKVAELVKQKYPECVIIFGGPHVPTGDESWLKKYPFIDYAVYKEGEIVFHNLLRRVLGMEHETKGMGFLHNNKLNQQHWPERIQDLDQIPSPYTQGYFDNLIEKYKNTNTTLNTVIETNRGCPFGCTFCDWGGVVESKVKKIPMCRVHEEILWMAKNKLEFVTGADANFGAFKDRDMGIVDFLVETKKKYGYPKYIHTNWHKNQNEHLVSMAKKLMDAGMMRSFTASLQSTNINVLDAIKRKNIGDNVLSKIKSMCEENGFKLHTELMMPLPGETYESFESCLEQCLDNDMSFTASYTTILPNSEMNDKAYRKKYGLQTVKNKFAEPHSWVDEEEEILVATKTMNKKQFNDLALLSYLMSGFHLPGFTDLISKYYKKTEGVSFTSFYKKFLRYFLEKDNTLVHRYLAPLSNHVDECRTNQTYGGIWSVPMFNEIGQDKREQFFQEVKEFCQQSLPANSNIDDLITLQYYWQDHTRTSTETELKFDSNLFDYINNQTPLESTKRTYLVKSLGKTKDFISLGHFLNFAKRLGNWKTSIVAKHHP